MCIFLLVVNDGLDDLNAQITRSFLIYEAVSMPIHIHPGVLPCNDDPSVAPCPSWRVQL